MTRDYSSEVFAFPLGKHLLSDGRKFFLLRFMCTSPSFFQLLFRGRARRDGEGKGVGEGYLCDFLFVFLDSKIRSTLKEKNLLL